METMNISLPEPLQQFVDEQMAEGCYSSVSELCLWLRLIPVPISDLAVGAAD